MSENNEYITVKEYAKRQGVGKSTVNRKIAAGLLSFIKVKGRKRVKADDPCINPRTGSNKIKDLTGQKFHYLTVISFVELRKQRAYWLCQCDCGRINIVSARQLITEDVKSCGCYKNNPGVQARRIQTKEKYYIDGVAIPRLTAKIGSNNTSGKKGVSFDKSVNLWKVYIHYNYKRVYVGAFRKFKDAVRAREKAEKIYHEPLIAKYQQKKKKSQLTT